ncbi:MAG TPA: carbon-nitrogen hydrolase family protein [Bryobacteraceae bacterium]|nr:carbon-nitrogen hydrolase family protein [Bryobacteraceae bacterium]
MSLVIAAAQSRSRAGDVAWNVSRHLQIGALAAEREVDLLVFPELSLTGYELSLGRSHAIVPASIDLDPLRRLAMDSRMTVVVGGPVRNDRDELNIGAFSIRPDGSASTYTKEHVHESEVGFTSGPGGKVLEVGDSMVALAICADASYPSHAARAAERGANVYAASVMIEEDAYLRKTALLQTYALQHGMAVLMANYSGSTGGLESAGKSAVWAEDGRLIVSSSGRDEVLVIGRKENGVWNGSVIPVT